MKAIFFILIFWAGVFFLGSCSDVKRTPGLVYMPDMAYSRAYETYSDFTELTEENIDYTREPVAGTIARGEELPFLIAKDAPGDSTNYVASRQIQNPLPPLSTKELQYAERIYLINCAICHGTKLDGNGPLYKGGTGPFPAQPANLIDLAYQSGKIYHMPDGQMFYSITYGKNLMGPYGSQLTRKQRWMIIDYIKSQRAAASKTTPGTDSTQTTRK